LGRNCNDREMPRVARAVFPGIPHHITQRGNRGEEVFFVGEDRLTYLRWLSEYCQKYEVKVLAYCLMTNHIHLVMTPSTAEGLQRVLKPLHMRYSQRVNRARGWKGHLWQGRFFSSPLDEAYLWAAIRYVERNPVRAGMVVKAEEYRWSSAAAHCGLRSDKVLTQPWLAKVRESIEEWSLWLSGGDDEESIRILRRNIEKGLPCGSEGFIQKLGIVANRMLEYRPQGRPKYRCS
jgi:putative transposase